MADHGHGNNARVAGELDPAHARGVAAGKDNLTAPEQKEAIERFFAMAFKKKTNRGSLQLVNTLKNQHLVWRDKTNLHAGERWPKKLGDAIAEAEALVLLWSTDASHSDFVELEWNIVILPYVVIFKSI